MVSTQSRGTRVCLLGTAVLFIGLIVFAAWPRTSCRTGCERTTSYRNFVLPLADTTFANLVPTDKVIFVGLDGFGIKNMHSVSAVMPYFHKLKNSSLSGEALIDCLWWSGPNWYGVISGLNSKDSEVCDNDDQAAFPRHRTIWDVAHNRGKSVGVFTEWRVFTTYGRPAIRTNGVNPREFHDTLSGPWLTDVVVPAFDDFDFLTVMMDGHDGASHDGDTAGFRNISAHYDEYLFKPLWEYVESHAGVAVVMTSDHGSFIPEATHDQNDHVPFMVRAPGLVARETTTLLANNMVAGVVARLLGA